LRVFILAILLVASGCARGEAKRCDVLASSEVNFTATEQSDVVEARALGADCGAAVAVYVVRSREGLPVWAWAAPFHPTFGDSFAPRAQGALSHTEMEAFLERWAAPDVSTTRGAPAWHDAIVSPFDEATYEDIRTRGAPMICYLTSVARQTCIYWESGVAAAGVLVERDAPGSAAQDEGFMPGQMSRE